MYYLNLKGIVVPIFLSPHRLQWHLLSNSHGPDTVLGTLSVLINSAFVSHLFSNIILAYKVKRARGPDIKLHEALL